MATRRALTTETLQLLANNIGGMLIGLIGTILVTRALGPEARGIYAWLLTLLSLAAAMSLLTPYNVVRKLGADTPESGWPALIGTLSVVNLAATVLTLPLLMWALMQPLGQHATKLLIAVWAILPITVVGASLAAFIHLRKQPSATLLSMLTSRGSITLLIILAWCLGVLSLNLAVLLNLFLAVISFLVFLAWLGIPLHTWRFEAKRLTTIRHFLGASWLSGMALFAMPKLPLLLLPHYVPLADIGNFSLATTLLDISIMFPAAAASVLVTHFTRSGHAGGKRQALLALFAFVGTMAVCGYILTPFLIPLMFGEGFEQAIPLFRLLLIALIAQAPLAVWGSAVMASGSAKGLLVPPLVGLAASFAFCFILLPKYGVTGAAIAVILSYAVQTLALLPFLKK